MAKQTVVICDRCGNTIDPAKDDDWWSTAVGRPRLIYMTPNNVADEKDLCGRCRVSLNNWFIQNERLRG